MAQQVEIHGIDVPATATIRIPRGTSLPASCSVGQMFFKTDAGPGTNLHLCTSANTWTQVQGSGGGGGGSFDPSATYDLTGLNKVNINYLSLYLQNNPTTGTALYRTVCLNSDGTVSQCDTLNAGRTLGICMEGCGTSGNARIAIRGFFTCDFDGSVTAGNWATISSTVAGKCTDAGTSKPSVPLGIILVTQAGQGSYDIVRGIQ